MLNLPANADWLLGAWRNKLDLDLRSHRQIGDGEQAHATVAKVNA